MIKPKSKVVVYPLLFLVFCLLAIPTGFCEELNTTEEPATEQAPTEEGPLPSIEARKYKISVVRRSNSNRVYLFDDVEKRTPDVNHLILAKADDDPVMAFRVLKYYPEKNQFAARWVKKYEGYKHLNKNSSYQAVEKLSDKTLAPPTAQDKADIKEIENQEGLSSDLPPATLPDKSDTEESTTYELGPPEKLPEVVSFDTELDAGTSPSPDNEEDDDAERLEEDNDDPITVDEIAPIDRNRHWLGAEGGYFRNGSTEGQSPYYKALGLRYGITLGSMILIRKAHAQDSLVLEGGTFLYKILGFFSTTSSATPNDSYTVLPIMGDLRYNILVSEDFGLFFYGGFVHSMVIETVNPDKRALAVLSSSYPTGGGGFLFRMGPNWLARINLGIDLIGAGLLLRF